MKRKKLSQTEKGTGHGTGGMMQETLSHPRPRLKLGPVRAHVPGAGWTRRQQIAGIMAARKIAQEAARVKGGGQEGGPTEKLGAKPQKESLMGRVKKFFSRRAA